ncbi:MAG: lysophospholipid acyltransferase family protein [Myxococcota bacterium]|nr:lysophospholipid acyltransferase family protein [Myxococcota bacterium]
MAHDGEMSWWMKARVGAGGVLTMVVGLLFSLWFIPVASLGFKRLARRLHPCWAWATLRCLGARLETQGLEHLPEGGFIAAATHHSLMDTVTYLAVLPPETCYLGKAELSRRPVFAQSFRLMENIFVDREDGERALEKILEHVQTLPASHNIFLHPEGTRGPEGRVRPLTPGVINLAVQTRKPIVPMISTGGEALWPKGALLPLPGPVAIIVGEPISTTDWSMESYGAHLDELRGALHKLMNPKR